jgi:hypothetical protein
VRDLAAVVGGLGGRAYGGDPTAVGVLDCTTIDYQQLFAVCAGGERALVGLYGADMPAVLPPRAITGGIRYSASKPPVCRAFA